MIKVFVLTIALVSSFSLIAQEIQSVKSLKSADDKAIDQLRPNSNGKNFQTGTYINYVNPFIGTGGHGHTYPGASAPFGMMQLSPDTRYEGWDGCSGYHYSDSIIYGFSHTHLNGTGVPDYCDLLIVPQMGEAKKTPGYLDPNGYGAAFKHINEKAGPGYYAVKLLNGIGVRLTVSERAGMHHYVFPDNQEKKHILVDLDHRDKLILADFDIKDNHSMDGFRVSNAWASEQHFYFSMEFNADFESYEIIQENGTNKVLFTFPSNLLQVMLKVGMSATDIQGAKNNLNAEIPTWDFNEIQQQTAQKWENELSKIKVESSDKNKLINFYSALYHTFLSPNIFSDVDGRYRGRDNQIHQLNPGETQYTVFSLWDTYRGAHPLFTIVQQERTADFIKTFQRQFEQGGDLPVWELAGNETECMIGYHSVSVIADAYLKNVPGIDIKPLINQIIATSNFDEFGKKSFNERGFIGLDKEPESVSKSLEYAYDSYCIYQILKKAKSEGHSIEDQLIDEYLLRSFNFVNTFDPQTGFMRARKDGMWFSPFKPEEVNFNYTEANSWQYSLYAPHAISTLSELLKNHGGLEGYLNRLFSTKSELSGRHQVDITGLIGQYAHGNEPSHHMAYLYNYTNSSYKTAEIVDSILNHLYFNAPDGLSGNEDCGQMSAWYVLSALGFYPVSPGKTDYDLGRPLFDKATLRLENGKMLTINYLNNSKNNKYIQSLVMNSGPLTTTSLISHNQLMEGGIWTIQMGNKPSTDPNRKNKTDDKLPNNFTPVPYFTQENRVFDKSMSLALNCPLNSFKFEIFYTTDGSIPSLTNGKKYTKPFEIKETTIVRAAVYNKANQQFSDVITNEFVKKEEGISITIETLYANQYAAGGETTLIDGIRGNEEFRTGDWQGYWATDIKAKVNFKKPKSFKSIGINCLEDTKSWIFAPIEVEFFIEYEDGQTEKVSDLRSKQEAIRKDQKGIHTYKVKPQSKGIKSIKVVAKNYGKCPEWHLGAGNDTWLFADELFFE